MVQSVAEFLERVFKISAERTIPFLSRAAVASAALFFLLLATFIVAFDSLLPGQSFDEWQIDATAPRNVFAPEEQSYVSRVLTDRLREEARDSVPPRFNPPDVEVARSQTDLANRILTYINNVRADSYATPEQQARDIDAITALTLDEVFVDQILQMDAESWSAASNEVTRLLEQVMRESITTQGLAAVQERLPNLVTVRFDTKENDLIVAIVEDLVRPNRTQNDEATELDREAAAAAIPDQERTFQRGQRVISQGDTLDELAMEALEQLGFLQPADQRVQEIARAFLASLVVMVISGLYLARFRPTLLYNEPRLLTLMAVIFVLVLAGARFSLGEQIYLFPTAFLGLLYVAIIGPNIAIIGMTGVALLIGIMANNSLEIATMVTAGGIIGVLSLRRPERLNSYFVAGLMISIINVAVVAIFHVSNLPTATVSTISTLMLFSLLNGVLTAAATVVGLYLIGQIFNLTTAIKLIELSQPNQPLLQRLLREAPGSYQHSLQVANLGEQAATAIGADADLVRVAALYHDIGKMLNPAFFTENQRDSGNPHDTLNDPYRSADIIIGHVTEGDAMARKYRLPNRIRDFIREHHGTTQVFVFYQQALAAADDDKSAVDISEFTYPGPRPQTRETAVLMLADSSEAAIRAVQPQTKQEIEETVDKIIEGKRKAGQLNESGLTLNDLDTIRRVFLDILKAMFHPRINYTEAVSKARNKQQAAKTGTRKATATKTDTQLAKAEDMAVQTQEDAAIGRAKSTTVELPKVIDDDDDDSPLPDVPPLPRSGNGRPRDTDANNPKDRNGSETPTPDPENAKNESQRP